jgi:hypothetical protein
MNVELVHTTSWTKGVTFFNKRGADFFVKKTANFFVRKGDFRIVWHDICTPPPPPKLLVFR